jgi:N-acetylglucosamine transport system permease protein
MTTATTPTAPADEQLPARRSTSRSDPLTGSGLRPLDLLTSGFLVFWALLTAFPLLWAIMTSLKTNREILSSPWQLPASPQLDNFVRAWGQANIGQYFVNSVIVVGGALVLTMLLGSMAAYVLARYEFPGNRIVYYAFVGGMTFPVFLALVPLFFIVDNMKLLPVVGQFLTLNSYGGLILVYAAYSLPFTVFFMTAFFRTLPTTIAEAALIDGCGHFGLFFRVMLPMARPGLVSVGIFNFLGQWNQYLLPVVLMTEPDKRVLAQGLASLAVSQGYRGDWSALFAGLTLAMLPVLAVYLLFQRHVQAGLSAGLLK